MISDYLKEMEVNGKSKSAVKNTRVALEGLERSKPLDQVTKDDLIDHFEYLDKINSGNTPFMKRRIIKKYYKDIGQLDMVDWIKIKHPVNSIDPGDLITVDDVNLLIKTSISPMYKALIAILFETGGRISEILNIKIGDLEDDEYGLIVSIENLKTKNSALAKYRKMLLVFSAQYLRNWISYGNHTSDDDKLFEISYSAVSRYLVRLSKKAKIDKIVTPHKFRHAQATDMVRRGYQETIIRKKLGWTLDSKMISRYIHLVDDDVINAQKEMAGDTAVEKIEMLNVQKAEKITVVNDLEHVGNLVEENKLIKKELETIKSMIKGFVDTEISGYLPGELHKEIHNRDPEMLYSLIQVDDVEYQRRKDKSKAQLQKLIDEEKYRNMVENVEDLE